MHPRDVRAALTTIEADLLGIGIREVTSFDTSGSLRDDSEHATPVGLKFTGCILPGAAVENAGSLHGVESADDIAAP